MPDRKTAISDLDMSIRWIEDSPQHQFPGWGNVTMAMRYAVELLKEQEIPTELKQKMWNALYAEEEEYEKKFVGKEEHLNWFTVYRPWLQKGFDIAINVIADWEGR